METAVIIARFQTPYLHEGHVKLITEVKSRHDKLVIVLGISQVMSGRRNPYDYYTREVLIKNSFPEVVVLPLSDHPSDKVWSQHLDQLLAGSFPNEKFILYGSRSSFINSYSGKNHTLELPEHGDYNASELRKKYADKVIGSNDFRAGILYAYHNQFKKVHPTVDVALFRNHRTQLLLGRKEISAAWRLPGGFVDPEDDDYEAAARRELTEECGDIEAGEMHFEKTCKVDDWRYRNEVDKIITTLFSCDLLFGQPQAKDDLTEVAWFDLDRVQGMLKAGTTTPEHTPLLQHLINKYTLKNKLQ